VVAAHLEAIGRRGDLNAFTLVDAEGPSAPPRPSAAAVAAGLTPVGIGTDTGGSVRVPAALCGLVGLKVTRGRIPPTGVFPPAPSLDTVGPLTRTVGDAALVYLALAGADPADPWSLSGEVAAPGGPADLTGCRFPVPVPWAADAVSGEVRDGFRFSLEALGRAGAELEQVRSPDLAPPGLIEESTYPEAAAVHRAWMQAHPERYGPDVRSRLERALAMGPAEHAAGLAWRARVRRGNEPPPSLQVIGRREEKHRRLEIGLALEGAGIVCFRWPAGSAAP